MLPQARPTSAESSWIDIVRAHVRARSLRVVGASASERTAIFEELRATRVLQRLQVSTYPDSDILRVPPEVAGDVEPTRFVTSSSAVAAGILHRWMSAAWVDKRFWRALQGIANGATLTVLPLRLEALGRTFSAVVVTDINALVASLLRLAVVDGEAGARESRGARVLVMAGKASREERFICTSVDDTVLWSSGWYTGPEHVIEETLAVGFPSLECLKTPGTWAAPATVACFEERNKTPTTIAFVGGAWDERLAASWAKPVKRGSARLLGDGPHWFSREEKRLLCAPPLTACRLPLRALRAPKAASILACLRGSLLFTNAAATEAGLPWWDERGDPPPPGELLDWDGLKRRPGDHRATHPDATVMVPYSLLRSDDDVAHAKRHGDAVDAVIFVVEVHGPEAVLIEARTWSEGVALAMGFDALGGHVHDPLALRSFPGDASAGLRAWVDLGGNESTAPRVFVWTVPKHVKEATRLAPADVTTLVADAVHGEPAAAKSPLGAIRAASRSHLEARAVVEALGRALDELGSRCPPVLQRAHRTFLAGLDA